MVDYVPLHVHSEYSLNDSLLRIHDIVAFAQTHDLTSIALTDRNNLYAAIKFYQCARRAKIKPILGCDLSIRDEVGQIHQLILLAQNALGFRHLCELVSFAYTHDQTPNEIAVDKTRLTAEQCQGLIALSGGEEGDVGKAIARGDRKHALQCATHWQKIFSNRFYLQIARFGQTEPPLFSQNLAEIGQKLRIAAVATNLACFKTAADFDYHEARVCIASGDTIDNPKRVRRFTPQHHLRAPQDLAQIFADAPQLLVNTELIAQRCNVVLSLGKHYLPDFPLPECIDIERYLVQEAERGLEERLVQLFPDPQIRAEKTALYQERLQTELAVINRMQFPGYFLIVADFIQWAKNHDVPVGPGRGSGAGSLVAFCLKITELDPMAYDLLFERFLNPERVSMPDFDVDFCMNKRDDVIRYVADKYGHDKVSQIATHGTMAAKAVIRDVGRVLSLPYPVVDKISKMVPNTLGVTLPDALGKTEKSRTHPEFFSAELTKRYEEDEEVKYLIDIALPLEGLARNVGKHAGGVVIAPTTLTDFSALYCEHAGSALVTQFDKEDIEAAGLVKFDFLGLRTLTVIDWAVQNVNQYAPANEKLDIRQIRDDDEATFQLLKSGKTTAVFQLESSGMKNLIAKLQPDNFEDLIALVALFRPGPLQSGMVDDFINRKHGRAKVVYPHPALAEILKNTYGVMVYQEQVMQVAQILAKYSLGEADLLRRAMGKKKPEEMAKQKGTFVARASAGGVDEQVAIDIFDLMAKFAEYGFNKSHSAAYALLSYQTAWLKAHYPAAFMAAVLTSEMDKTEKIVLLIDECHEMGLRILPPSINHSAYDFTINQQGEILFGLGAIKGVGQAVIEQILAERRRGGAFQSLTDLCQRLDLKTLKRKTLETLIYAGAFDLIEKNRGALFAVLPQALKLAEQYHQDKKNRQTNMFSLLDAAHCEAHLALNPENSWQPQQQLMWEKSVLGLFLSGHPAQVAAEMIRPICPKNIAEIQHELNQKTPHQGEYHFFYLGGLLVDKRNITSKKGKNFCFITVDDCSGKIEIAVPEELLQTENAALERDTLIIAQIKARFVVNEQSENWRYTLAHIYTVDDARYQLATDVKIESEINALTPQFLNALASWRRTDDDESTAGVTLYFALRLEQEAVAASIRLGGRYRFDRAIFTDLAHHFGSQNIHMHYRI